MGVRDLHAEVLRTPRNPDVVFADDPTRMLRAAKFVLKYGFTVESKTAASIRRNAHLLATVPYEAVASLLAHEILTPGHARAGMRVLERLGLGPAIGTLLIANKGFVTYLSDVLRDAGAYEIQIAVDTFGWPIRHPLATLTPEQRARLVEVNDPVLDAAVAKPRLDNAALIREFAIPAHERGNLATLARLLLLEQPRLAHGGPYALTQAMARYLRAR
jgi:tRNA nucleotidyltransferase/poly(A) polymerase